MAYDAFGMLHAPARHPARVARTPAKLCGGRVPRRLGMRSGVWFFCAFSPQARAPRRAGARRPVRGKCGPVRAVEKGDALFYYDAAWVAALVGSAYFSARAGGRDAAGAGSAKQGQASEAPTSRVGVALQKIRRVWAQRRGIVAEDAAWEALAKGLEPVSIGEPPRKGTAELAAVVDAAAALLEMHTESTQVHASALPALVSAVRFYYITPSATLYRALVLQEKVLPGQRLNYAFDYQHFDTGQLSQVHLCFCYALIVVILTCMLSWYFYARFLQVIGSSFRT